MSIVKPFSSLCYLLINVAFFRLRYLHPLFSTKDKNPVGTSWEQRLILCHIDLSSQMTLILITLIIISNTYTCISPFICTLKQRDLDYKCGISCENNRKFSRAQAVLIIKLCIYQRTTYVGATWSHLALKNCAHGQSQGK